MIEETINATTTTACCGNVIEERLLLLRAVIEFYWGMRGCSNYVELELDG